MKPFYTLLILIIFSTCAWAEPPRVSTASPLRVQSLYDLYLEAKQNNPTLASAQSSNQAAQEQIEQAKAGYRPTLTVSASARTSRTNTKIIGSNNPFQGGANSFETKTKAVEARQPIFRKEAWERIGQSEVQVSIADKQYHQAKQDLMLRTTQAYFDTLLAQDEIMLIQAQKAAILSQLDQAKATFQVGTATITDVNEAQARYDLTIAEELSAKNELEIAKRALQALTGSIPNQLASVKSNIQVTPIQQDMQAWLYITRKNNLEVQIRQDSIQLSEQDIKIAQAGHFPTLDFVASYTEIYANGGQNGFGNDSNNSSASVEFAMPLYLGGAVSSRVREASFNQQRALDDLQATLRNTDLETQRAYLNLNTSIVQVQALEQALISSQTQLDSTKLGYEVGVRTSVDILNAQQQFYSAKRDLLQARYNYLVNIIRLKTSSGIISETDLQDIDQHLTDSRQLAQVNTYAYPSQQQP